MIKLFECFAGYGGAHWGLKLAGISTDLIGYSEIKPAAIQCYEQNFPEAKGKNYGDITKINWAEVPDFDLLTGGFPCQDVSTQGKQDLGRGRTVLINNLIEALKVKQPKYFLFENVSNIQADKFKDFLRQIRFDLDKVGYQVFFKELQSCDYGTPNYRIRVWFIGYRKDLAKPFGFSPYPVHSETFRVIQDILEPRQDSYLINAKNVLVDRNKRKKREILELGQYQDSPFQSAYKVLSPFGISTTLTCNINPSWLVDGRVYKPTEKELFRVQGFLNDEINLEGLSWNKCLDLAGDGWDVYLVKQIFLSMFKDEGWFKEFFWEETKR
jgi:DNA (cytosine-5)-methyltransferase 1